MQYRSSISRCLSRVKPHQPIWPGRIVAAALAHFEFAYDCILKIVTLQNQLAFGKPAKPGRFYQASFNSAVSIADSDFPEVPAPQAAEILCRANGNVAECTTCHDYEQKNSSSHQNPLAAESATESLFEKNGGVDGCNGKARIIPPPFRLLPVCPSLRKLFEFGNVHCVFNVHELEIDCDIFNEHSLL
jgi:hypothetical protein